MTRRLSHTQKELLDQIWNRFLMNGLPFPVRSLPRIIGKQAKADALNGLNGLLLESLENNDRSLKLTIHGAFLTGYGSVLFSLLFRLLEWLKKLYEEDEFINELDSRMIRAGLQLSEAESTQLLALLRLGLPPRMPFQLKTWGGGEGGWVISVTEGILELYQCDDVLEYLNDRLSEGYDPNEPWEYEARQRRSLYQMMGAAQPQSGTEAKQMKILISWSGDLSHRVALALRDWIPVVLPFARAWVSSEDINKGRRWGAELAAELDTTNCGIVCLVPPNIEEPWLNFESGALSKVVDQAQVHPFLLGIRASDLKGPLSQFQATEFTQAELRKLIRSINSAAHTEALQPDEVDRNFQVSWPHLEQTLKPLAAEALAGTAAKGSKAASGPASAFELSEEEVNALKAMLDTRGSIDSKFLSVALNIHEQRALHILERLDSLDFVYVTSGPAGVMWHLSPAGRTELVTRNLL